MADAKRFLSDLLADGPLSTKVVRGDSDGAGYSWATIRRAQKALNVESFKAGGAFGGKGAQWSWRLPALAPKLTRCSTNPEDAQQKVVSIFSKFEHLQQNDDVVEVEI